MWWIVLPAMAAFILYISVNYYLGLSSCEKICRKEGYAKATYRAPYRFAEGKCICLEPVDMNMTPQKTKPF
jgi:hypothetical protein